VDNFVAAISFFVQSPPAWSEGTGSTGIAISFRKRAVVMTDSHTLSIAKRHGVSA
jgi:hypothetical protein